MSEEKIGRVTHYFPRAGVAVIELEEGSIKVGDMIRVIGRTTDFTQKIDSIEIEHQKVQEVKPGDSFGIKITEKVRECDVVYKVTED